jgi:hypothetical protein
VISVAVRSGSDFLSRISIVRALHGDDQRLRLAGDGADPGPPRKVHTAPELYPGGIEACAPVGAVTSIPASRKKQPRGLDPRQFKPPVGRTGAMGTCDERAGVSGNAGYCRSVPEAARDHARLQLRQEARALSSGLSHNPSLRDHARSAL